MTILSTIYFRSRSSHMEHQEEQRVLYHRYKAALEGFDSIENLQTRVACWARSESLESGECHIASDNLAL